MQRAFLPVRTIANDYCAMVSNYPSLLTAQECDAAEQARNRVLRFRVADSVNSCSVSSVCTTQQVNTTDLHQQDLW